MELLMMNIIAATIHNKMGWSLNISFILPQGLLAIAIELSVCP